MPYAIVDETIRLPQPIHFLPHLSAEIWGDAAGRIKAAPKRIILCGACVFRLCTGRSTQLFSRRAERENRFFQRDKSRPAVGAAQIHSESELWSGAKYAIIAPWRAQRA